MRIQWESKWEQIIYFNRYQIIQIPNFKIVLSSFFNYYLLVSGEKIAETIGMTTQGTQKKMKIREELIVIQQLEMTTK